MIYKKSSGVKGFILITAIMVASILIIISIPYISRVTAEYKLMSKIHNSTVSLNLAEAGIERALWEIRYNNAAFSASGGWSTTTDGNGNRTCTISVNSFKAQGGNTIGDYDVIAWVSSDATKGIVTGKGYVPSRTNCDARRTIKVTCSKSNFASVIRATGDVNPAISLGVQNIVDSYDSSQGTYAQTHTNSYGNIATNGSIVFGNQAKVWGDAHPGVNYPFPSQPSNVVGAWGTLQAPLVVDPVPATALVSAQASNDNDNIVKGSPDDPSPLSGYDLIIGIQKTATLPGGTYYFTSISVGKQASLNISGPSTIYVDGGNISVNTQGNINNLGVPKNLTIYSTGSTIALNTQSDLYAAIYAPNADVSLTTQTAQGEIFGAVVCRTFSAGTQAAMHFDRDLLNVSPVFAASGVDTWQEIHE